MADGNYANAEEFKKANPSKPEKSSKKVEDIDEMLKDMGKGKKSK